MIPVTVPGANAGGAFLDRQVQGEVWIAGEMCGYDTRPARNRGHGRE